jgi:hypothetical protein
MTDSVEKTERDYPSSMEEILDDSLVYDKNTLLVLRKFREFGPWRGPVEERIGKYLWLNEALCMIYGQNVQVGLCPDILSGQERSTGNGGLVYQDDNEDGMKIIYLTGKLSVITFLHEWGHAIHGSSELLACRWSVNLFRKIFPRQFEKLNSSGHMLRV